VTAGLRHPELRTSRGRFISRREDFSGGERPDPANFVFRELAFTVEKIGETRPDPVERRDLTAAEVSLIVADSFDMLRLDLAGQEFVASTGRRRVPSRKKGGAR
jgi:hypothetical protein